MLLRSEAGRGIVAGLGPLLLRQGLAVQGEACAVAKRCLSTFVSRLSCSPGATTTAVGGPATAPEPRGSEGAGRPALSGKRTFGGVGGGAWGPRTAPAPGDGAAANAAPRLGFGFGLGVGGGPHLQSRSFKKKSSYYWPNIKKTWERDAVPEVAEVDPAELGYPEEYTKAGTITEKYKKLEGEEAEVFAVVEVGGKQYKVTPDDLVFVDRREDLDVNDVIELNRVLLLGTKEETVIGRPYVPNVSVVAAVESHFMEKKKIVFKKKRRNNYRRNNGFRARITRLRIIKVNGF